jgi:hypothetical protein
LLDEIDHGDGSLGRETGGGAPEVAIQHEVAEDADAFSGEAREQALELSAGGFGFTGHDSRRVAELFGGDPGLFQQHNRNIVADGIDPAAGLTFQACLIWREGDRRLAQRADENIKQLF